MKTIIKFNSEQKVYSVFLNGLIKSTFVNVLIKAYKKWFYFELFGQLGIQLSSFSPPND